MSLPELYALIESRLTRVGSNLVGAPDIKEVAQEIVNFFSNQNLDLFPDWSAALTFNSNGSGAGKYCKQPDSTGKVRIWQSLTNGNINNQPPVNTPFTSAFWQEISPSTSSAVLEWAAGVYGTGLQIVFYSHSTDGDGLYKLVDPVRPFTSTNIEAEILAGKWAKFQGQSIGRYSVSTSGATITCDWLNKQEAVFVGSASLAANKTIAFSNAGLAQNGTIILVIGGGGPYDVIFPSAFVFPGEDGSWNNGTKTLTMYPGRYKIKFDNDGTNYVAESKLY